MSIRCFISKHILNRNPTLRCLVKHYSQDTPTSQDATSDQSTKSGFAKAFDKFENVGNKHKEKPQSFKELLMNSKFVDVSISESHFNIELNNNLVIILISVL